MKLLIIEDELSLQELIACALKKEGYVVETASDCMSALDKLSGYDYDCVLLDINLPDGSGLELGADDYLAKPFHLAELSARIRSVARRSRNGGELVWKAGNVVLEDATRRLT